MEMIVGNRNKCSIEIIIIIIKKAIRNTLREQISNCKKMEIIIMKHVNKYMLNNNNNNNNNIIRRVIKIATTLEHFRNSTVVRRRSR